jgi:hypothetical protein
VTRCSPSLEVPFLCLLYDYASRPEYDIVVCTLCGVL